MTAQPPWALSWAKACKNRDPLEFVHGVLGVPLHDPSEPESLTNMEAWQQEALEALRDGKQRLSIRSGHGVGKTTFLAWLVLFGLLCLGPDTKIPIAAGSHDQLRDTIQPEISKWKAKLPPALANQVSVQAERVVMLCAPEEAFAVFRTASKDNPQALAGFHAKNILFLIDEASAVAEVAFEVAMGALSTRGAMVVLTGNPSKAQGFFYDTHHKMRELWKTMRVNSEDVPRARDHIELVIAAYGKGGNKYRVRVLGEFPTQEDETVIALEHAIAARGRDICISDVFPVWGVDVGRFGDDASALVKRQGNSLLYHDMRPPIFEWRGFDGAQIAAKIQAEYRATVPQYRPKEIVVDVIGVGCSVYDILRLEGSECREAVRGANVSELPSSSELEYRLRDELWFAGRTWFAERTCHLPSKMPTPEDEKLVEKLIGELTAVTYDYHTGTGKRVVESKRDMKKRLLPSPNLADAFLLTFAAGIHPRRVQHKRSGDDAPLSWRAA